MSDNVVFEGVARANVVKIDLEQLQKHQCFKLVVKLTKEKDEGQWIDIPENLQVLADKTFWVGKEAKQTAKGSFVPLESTQNAFKKLFGFDFTAENIENLNDIIGSEVEVKCSIRTYTKDGEEREATQIDKMYNPNGSKVSKSDLDGLKALL